MKLILPCLLLFICITACEKKAEVVIYTALDRSFSEPILQKFTEQTGIQVLCKYDTESTKTVGLTACLLEERNQPRCDVFWNNEILHTLRLKKAGVLAPYKPSQTPNIPKMFYDPDGYWTGFAARARVFLVNTKLVKEQEYPSKLIDLQNPRWKGKFGVARPIAGTTATHFACLFSALGSEQAQALFDSWKANQVAIQSGNKSCAEKVGAGELDICLTDTDDAMIEILQKQPVVIVYPDSRPDEIGTLLIPNTLALIAGGPNPENGKKLIEFLLSPEVEALLASGPSAQIPLNTKVTTRPNIKTHHELHIMSCDFESAAELWPQVQEYVVKHFLLSSQGK